MDSVSLTSTVQQVMTKIRKNLEADDTKFKGLLGMSLGLQMDDKVATDDDFNALLEKMLLVKYMKGADCPEKVAITAAIKADSA